MVTFFPKEQNFIKSQLVNGCARPWYVWVETFIPAFVELFITVNLFDVEDVLRSHGKQISREGGRKTGRGGRHGGVVKVVGKKPLVNRFAAKGLATLLVITQPLEFIGLAWLIYAATDQFFFNWQTALELSDFCKNPIEAGPLQRSRGPGFISIVEAGVPVILPTLFQNRAGWANGELSAALPEGAYEAIFALTVKGPVLGVSGVFIQFRVLSIFGVGFLKSDEITLAEGEEGTMLLRASFFLATVAGGSISWEIAGATIPAGIESVKGHMLVQRVG